MIINVTDVVPFNLDRKGRVATVLFNREPQSQVVSGVGSGMRYVLCEKRASPGEQC